jgi:hypothetical protein
MNPEQIGEVNNVVFFNHYENGDSFINREYVKEIIKKYSNASFFYAHKKHPSLFKDLPVQQITLGSLPADINEGIVIGYSTTEKTLYVNCWVGCHMRTGFLRPGSHANFPLLHRAWSPLLEVLHITVRSWEDYHPAVDYSAFDLSEANAYLNRIGSKPLVLICNGKVASRQSDMGEMVNTISTLANEFPDHEFLVAYKLDMNLPNITYTDDIFGSHEGNLHHIGYIGNHAKVIVGKNSGPFSFCHNKENMNDPKKTFICFSKHAVDSLMGEGEYSCNSVFSGTTDEVVAANVIRDYITNPRYATVKKKTEVLQN